MPRRDPTAYPNPPKLPEGAIGFVAIRPDQPERFALYRPDGTLSNSFARLLDISVVENISGLRLVMTWPWTGCWAAFRKGGEA